MKKTSLMSNTALWLGAAFSVTEIMSGAMIASIGLRHGLLAIIIGHILGGILFFLCGKMGADTGYSSMDCVAFSYGSQGAGLFAIMNAFQLIAWTVIMLHISAQLLTTLSHSFLPYWAWSLIIGSAVLLWLFLSNAQLGRINLIASSLLLCLTFYMCYHSFGSGFGSAGANGFTHLTFGSAIEVSAALSVSWLPLISDYTSKAERPVLTTAMSTLTYIFGSMWMFVIGLGAAAACGNIDFVQIMIRMDILRVPMIIVLLSTVTTIFIKACSAGISSRTIFKNKSVRSMSAILLTIAIIFSIVAPFDSYAEFLMIISSVFVPMSTIMITDYYLLDYRTTMHAFDMGAMLLWAVGFVMYHLFLSLGLPCGAAMPVIIVLMTIRYFTEKQETKL